jgi:protein-L-isoaspartate(D-aspartate) O-methyltransferase
MTEPAVVSAPASLPVGRAHFVPDVIWVPAPGGYRAVHRDHEPADWAAAVAADEPVTTQVDDGATPEDGLGRRSSSSSSQPSLVAAMLDAARLAPGMRVLEIGTGTGWTAALLSHRLGSAAVTTLEVDPGLAERARRTIELAGFHPTVVTGDGAAGYQPNAPYDRVLATCSVTSVPYPWVEQTRPGGQILTPWGSEYANGALTRLTTAGDGTASGHFDAMSLAFMRLRAQRGADCPWDGDGPGTPEHGTTELTSRQVYELVAPPGAFAVGLLVDECHKVVDEDDLVVWLHDVSSGSWARCEVTAGASRQLVAQYGPRRLWDEAERAHRWWTGQGRPGLERFGLTVTAAGQQAWLDDPGNLVPAVGVPALT